VAFVSSRAEALEGWWEPFVTELERRPTAAICVEARSSESTASPVTATMTAEWKGVSDLCVVVRADALSAVGRFDTGLTLSSLDDFMMRAERVGLGSLEVVSGTIVARREFATGSSLSEEGLVEWSQLVIDEEQVLESRRLTRSLSASTPFLVLADAEEAVHEPTLLAAYGESFSVDDAAALVLFGPGLDPVDFEQRLEVAAIAAGFDLVGGPRLIALLPPTATEIDEDRIADEVFAVLSTKRPRGPLAALAWRQPSEIGAMREQATRMWASRPVEIEFDPALGAISDNFDASAR